jgi:hypothetical protein
MDAHAGANNFRARKISAFVSGLTCEQILAEAQRISAD